MRYEYLPEFKSEEELQKFLIKDDLFGWHCKIPYGHFYNKTQEKHIYKIVGVLGKSNTWCDIPDTYQNETPKNHDTMEWVVNVIHCGIDETQVLRFRLKDVEVFKIIKQD